MNLRSIFDAFSRRHRKVATPLKPLTNAFRVRVLMLCRDRFAVSSGFVAAGDYTQEFVAESHHRFCYLLGRSRLSNKADAQSPAEDLLQFLSDCSDDHFLDFIEGIFKANSYFHVSADANDMVGDINQLLLLEDLPYAITPFIHENRMEEMFGSQREVRTIASYPKVVLREDQVLHSEAVSPAIQLLADNAFTSANQEFLAALEDYRKGRYGDCLTKCGSAFESTMKLICTRRQWAYQQTDTARELLRIVMSNSGMDSYFEQPLLLIATIRNRLSSSHGAGAQRRSVPAHRARYAINATASAILLLVEECA